MSLITVTVSILLILISAPAFAAEKYELYIAQGIEKLNKGQFKEALDVLRKALELSPDNPEAEFYTAVAYSRMGKLANAERLLKKIRKNEEHAANVYLELGRIYYFRGECRAAERNLNEFKALSDNVQAKGYADSLISDCYSKEEAEKPYNVNLTAGVQYDSNVVLEATNPPVPADEKDDGRVVAMISAGARIFKVRQASGRVDYNFYQSGHFDLDQYNVHYHKISPSIELNISDIVTPSGGYWFEYINFGSEQYGIINAAFANLNIKEAPDFSIDVIYEFRDHDYDDTDEFPNNSYRSGRQNTVGVRQNFTWNDIDGDIHYFYDDKNAERDYWAYVGQRIGGVVKYKLMEPLTIKGSADYSRRRHNEIYPGFNDRRVDRMQKYAVLLQYSINNKLAVTVADTYIRNDSNLVDFDYERNIIGVLFTYGLL
jgi:tetratricopeptide (TPR) repeat protein